MAETWVYWANYSYAPSGRGAGEVGWPKAITSGNEVMQIAAAVAASIGQPQVVIEGFQLLRVEDEAGNEVSHP